MKDNKKIIVIAGGTGGLGKDLTRYLLKMNNIVAVTYNKEESFISLKNELEQNKNLYGFKVNVLDENNVLNFVEKIIQQFNRIDVLINLVGGYFGGVDIQNLTIDNIKQQFDLNFISSFICIKHLLPKMLEQNSGTIINIGSKQGLKGGAGASAYAASKAALINFTVSLAKELETTNITANVIVPGIIDTSANRLSMPDEDFSSWVTADEIGNIINTISSKESKNSLDTIIPLFGDQ